MVVIHMCRAAEIFRDPVGLELIAEYSAECSIAMIGKPAPRRDMYENLEQSGMAQCFAAYEDMVLVGFALAVVAVVPHYDLSCATIESLFVTRGATCGGELMQAVESYAADCGCKGMFYAAPVGSRLARLLFLSADQYVHTNHVFCKRLR